MSYVFLWLLFKNRNLFGYRVLLFDSGSMELVLPKNENLENWNFFMIKKDSICLLSVTFHTVDRCTILETHQCHQSGPIKFITFWLFCVNLILSTSRTVRRENFCHFSVLNEITNRVKIKTMFPFAWFTKNGMDAWRCKRPLRSSRYLTQNVYDKNINVNVYNGKKQGLFRLCISGVLSLSWK